MTSAGRKIVEGYGTEEIGDSIVIESRGRDTAFRFDPEYHRANGEYIQISAVQKKSGWSPGESETWADVSGRYVSRDDAEKIVRWIVGELQLDLSDLYQKPEPVGSSRTSYASDDETTIFVNGGVSFGDGQYTSRLEVFRGEHGQFGFGLRDYNGEPASIRWVDDADARHLAYEILDRTGRGEDANEDDGPSFVVFVIQ